MAQNQLSRHLWLALVDSASHRTQLLGVGTGVFHLQLRDQETALGMVEEVQHDLISWIGCRHSCERASHLLWYCVLGICQRPEVVGHGSVQAGV